MPLEIELKVKVESHDPVRARLIELGAARKRLAIESDTFFDTAGRTLLAIDAGLRLRHVHDLDANEHEYVLTHKGPRQPGEFKTRPEHELTVTSADDATAFLQALGYAPTISFEKRRESWALDNCIVALDDLPQLGLFVEIEGPDEQTVAQVRDRLGLTDLPPVTRGYVTMIAAIVET